MSARVVLAGIGRRCEHVMRLCAASPQLMSRASSDPGSTIDCGQLEDASDPKPSPSAD